MRRGLVRLNREECGEQPRAFGQNRHASVKRLACAGARHLLEGAAGGAVTNSTITNSFGITLLNQSSNLVRVFHLITTDNNGGGIVGNPVVRADF